MSMNLSTKYGAVWSAASFLGRRAAEHLSLIRQDADDLNEAIADCAKPFGSLPGEPKPPTEASVQARFDRVEKRAIDVRTRMRALHGLVGECLSWAGAEAPAVTPSSLLAVVESSKQLIAALEKELVEKTAGMNVLEQQLAIARKSLEVGRTGWKSLREDLVAEIERLEQQLAIARKSLEGHVRRLRREPAPRGVESGEAPPRLTAGTPFELGKLRPGDVVSASAETGVRIGNPQRSASGAWVHSDGIPLERALDARDRMMRCEGEKWRCLYCGWRGESSVDAGFHAACHEERGETWYGVMTGHGLWTPSPGAARLLPSIVISIGDEMAACPFGAFKGEGRE